MRRIQRIRPTGAAAAVGVALGAMVLAGCGAGQVTQTSTQVSGIDGANVNAGPIAVRNAQFVLTASGTETAVAFPSGGSAPLQMTIVNTGGTADTLVSASSPIAAGVQIQGTKEIEAGRTLDVAAAQATEASASGAAQPSSTALPTALPTATQATATQGSSESTVVLTGLREDIKSGQTYDVTLVFQRAGQVTVPVPVSVSSAPRTSEHSE